MNRSQGSFNSVRAVSSLTFHGCLEIAFDGDGLFCGADPDIDQTDRFLRCAAGWSRDPGGGDTNITANPFSCAGCHFLGGLLAHSAIIHQGLMLDAQKASLTALL